MKPAVPNAPTEVVCGTGDEPVESGGGDEVADS
jgi:hypothetical protein